MSISRDKAGALCFLLLAIVYGYYAGEIRMFPGDEDLPFNARTMPTALAWMTGIASFLLLILPDYEKGDNVVDAFKGLNWGTAAGLMGLMVVYGLTLSFFGFIISTLVFLSGGIFILGERRFKIIALTVIPVTVGFWAILTQLLGIYLAPGTIFQILGVA
jgi:putative tricarboxylic transport membrane protein